MKTTSSAPTPSRGPVDHEVRDQVVAAATEHFSRYGYEKTTLSDLAKAIGFSNAYIYKFFESMQAIGEMSFAQCIAEIEGSVAASLADAASPPDKIRRLFKAFTEASLRLLFQARSLYESPASAATEQWAVVAAYDQRVQQLLRDVLQEGRASGDFERKPPLDETVMAIYLALRPCSNPLRPQHSLHLAEEAPAHLPSLVLRSLSP